MPPIIFLIYPYINASVKTLFKQKQSSADLIHGLITKSDHSARVPKGYQNQSIIFFCSSRFD